MEKKKFYQEMEVCKLHQTNSIKDGIIGKKLIKIQQKFQRNKQEMQN